MKKILTSLTALILGTTLAAQASTITYNTTIGYNTTDWQQNLALQQFDPSLGTLNSIQITLSSGMQTVLNIQNNAASSSSGYGKTEVQISLDTSSIGNYNLFGSGNPILDYYSRNFTYSLAPGGSTTSGILTGSSSATSATLTDSTLLSDFTGTGYVNLKGSTFTGTLLSNTGGGTSASQTTSANLAGSITYNYTAPAAPVPEPTTTAVFGLGLISAMTLQRRRKKTAIN